MKINYTAYIIACSIFILLSIIDMIYPMERLLLKIAHLLTWTVLLVLELKKAFTIRQKEGKTTDYSSAILIFVVMIVAVLDMFR